MKTSRLRFLAGITESEEDSKQGHHVNIEKETLENTDYRRVLFTTDDTQLVVMDILPEQEIGAETHRETTQFFRIESGEGKIVVGEVEYGVKDGDSVIIPQNVRHNVINTSKDKHLKVYTLYSPPVHEAGTVEKQKP